MPKKPITTWVTPVIHKNLQDLAGAKGLTVSTLAANLLEQSLKQHAEQAGTELIVPQVEATLRRELRFTTERLARLLARSTLEASASRLLLFNLLLKSGLSKDEARRLNDAAWQNAVERLRKPLQALEEILGEEND